MSSDHVFTKLVEGENGTMEYTAKGVGDSRVALFFALVRGIPNARLMSLTVTVLHEAAARAGDSDEKAAASMVADLFVLAFQTRDCRGGKGEKDMFYQLFLILLAKFPRTALALLPQLGEFGYFKDYFRLIEISESWRMGETGTDPESSCVLALFNDKEKELTTLRKRVIELIANQLIADEAALEAFAAKKAENGAERKTINIPIAGEQQLKLSFCAKYVPREGKKFSKGQMSVAFRELREKLFPEDAAHSRAAYRKLIAKLTKALDVPEVKMCGKRYRDLSFAKVPSVCVNRHRKAFLNEKLKKVPKGNAEEVTGNRFPEDEDRVQCRKNMRQALVSKKITGKQLFPHEIVQQVYAKNAGQISTMEKDLYGAQWTSLRDSVLEKMAEAAAPEETGTTGAVNAEAAVSLGKLVPLVDVSGSMSGIPMHVAIALGILVSEVNHPAFRDRMLTFSLDPVWVHFEKDGNVVDKIQLAKRAPWGMNTNLEKAFELIVAVVAEQRLKAEEVPDLIIFSDMQFDSAVSCGSGRGGSSSGGKATMYDRIARMFQDVGVQVSGEPYLPPRIIFWNLRGDTVGFPAQADSRNVQMLSGFSPALLKFVMEGEQLEEEEEEEMEVEVETEDEFLVVGEDAEVAVTTQRVKTGKTVKVKKEPDPYETLRKVLDDERYDAVRSLLSESAEGLLSAYSFVPVVKEAPVAVAAAGEGDVGKGKEEKG